MKFKKQSEIPKIKHSSIFLFIFLIGFTLFFFNKINDDEFDKNQVNIIDGDLNGETILNDDLMKLKDSAFPNNWTIMVYIAADNNLEPAGLNDLNEMESVLLPEGIEFVVLFDRASGYSSLDGDWSTTRRFNITYDEDPDHITSEYEDLGELNMGDPNTLEDFIDWSKSAHPAHKYALILWDHGLGVSYGTDLGGACVDGYSAYDYLDLLEIDQAIEGKNIDLLGFDCCIMGMMEIASQYQTDVDIFVGSECAEPFDGWAYDLINEELKENSNCTPAELGEIICTTYAESYKYEYYWEDLPMVSLNLTKFAEIEEELYNFISTLNQDYNKSIANIVQKAIDASQIVESDEDYIDFGDFLSNLESFFHYAYSDLYQYSSNILEIYEEVVVSFKVARPRHLSLTGTSIRIFPFEQNLGYQNLDFCINTSWYEFITTQKTIGDKLVDDEYEPNDNFNQKKALTDSESINLIWSDQDWFEIFVIQNVSFSLILNETTFQSNEVDIILYDRYLHVVHKDPFNITLQLKLSGYYAICINSSLRFVEVPYTLTYTSEIVDDEYEYNNNFNTATIITPGYYSDLVCLDNDYYQIHVPESSILDVSIYTPDENLLFYIFLYDSSRNLINYWMKYYYGWYDMHYFMNNEEDLYILISPYNGFGYYLLNISSEVVEDDSFEQNDIIENACPIKPGYYSDLMVYDKDYYTMNINEGENLEIELYYSIYSTSFYIYDGDMNSIYSERHSLFFNSKFIYFNTLSYYSSIKQEITIVVYSYSQGTFGQYSMKISTTFQKDDIYEDNDLLEAAAIMQPGFYSNLKQLDDDFYKFTIQKGEYFEVVICSEDASYFRLKIYDSKMEMITNYYYYMEGSPCYYYSNLNQSITIEIRPYNENIAVTYSLNITLVKVTDDIYEENDLFESASPITIGFFTDLIYNDLDYYNLNISQGESIQITLESDLYMFLYLYDSSMNIIESTQGRNIFLKYYSHSNQSLTIFVMGYYSGKYGKYSIGISKQSIVEDDSYEENDLPGNAKEIFSGIYSELISLDDDYYNFSINAGEFIEISLFFRYDGITNINLFLYDSNLELLTYANSNYFNKSFTYYSEIDQNLIIFVEYGICNGNYCLRINYMEDDIFEENDVIESPANLIPGNYSELMQLDDDYYNISVREGMNYLIIVAPDDNDVYKSFTMILYDSDLTYISSGNSKGKEHYHAFNSEYNDSIIVRIYNYNSKTRMGAYCLNITVSVTVDDIYEENDFPETPITIGPGNYEDLINIDDDWYNISVEAGEILWVKVEFQNSYISYLSLQLFDTNLYSLNYSTYNRQFYHVSYYFEESQYVLIVVSIYYGFSAYTMNISSDPLYDDSYEQNDLPETAAVLMSGYYDNLKYYDNDYYNLTIYESEILDIQIESKYHYYFALTILNSNMEVLDEVRFYYYDYNHNDFSLRYFSEINQSVILHVYCTFRSGLYALNISTTFIGADDLFEENDASETATNINPGKYVGLICLDDDYYNLSMQRGDFVEITLEFDTNNVDFDLFIFNSSMGLLCSSQSRYCYESIQIFSENDQSIIILIQSNLGLDIYTLNISLTHFQEDIYEENDTPESATVILEGHYANLMCGDDDYFTITHFAGYYLSIWLTSFESNTDLDLRIYNSNMNLLNRSISSTSNEYIRFFSWSETKVIILVYSYFGRGAYNLTLEQSLIGDDLYEDNDLYETATLVSVGEYRGMIWIDMDFYMLNIHEDEQLEMNFEYNLAYFKPFCVIYDSEMNILYSTVTLDQCYHLSVISAQNQSIFIQIGSKNGIGSYNFTITIKEPIQDEPPIPIELTKIKDEINGFILIPLVISGGLIMIGVLIFIIRIKKSIPNKR